MYSGTSDSEDEGEFEDLTTFDHDRGHVPRELEELDPSMKKERSVDVPSENSLDRGEEDFDTKGLFGDESEDDDLEFPSMFGGEKQQQSKGEFGSKAETEEETTEPPEVVEYCAMPQLDPSSKNYLVDMPNILYVEPRPFDPDIYETVDLDKLEDPAEIRMRVENTIRWRYVQGLDGHLTVESNARYIEWSDGRHSLLVGDELLDVIIAPTPPHQCLVSIYHSDNLLISQTPLNEKMMFKPYGVTNKTHQKMASMLSRKFKRQPRTKVINLDKNLEEERKQQILAEQEVLKAQRRLEAKTRSLKAKYALNEDMDEGDDNNDENQVLHDGDGDRMGAGRRKAGGWRKERHRSPFSGQDDDDLEDFIVEDDEEPQRYNEEDEWEELERAEQLLSARREAGGEIFDHDPASHRSKKNHHASLLESATSDHHHHEAQKPSSSSSSSSSTIITIDDDDDIEINEPTSYRKLKKRAIVSDDEENDREEKEKMDE